MRAVIAHLIGEDPAVPYDAEKYTLQRAIDGSLHVDAQNQRNNFKLESQDHAPRVYGSPMQESGTGEARHPPPNSQEPASLGCWIVPPENYEISGARRQLATDAVHPRVPQQVAAGLPCTAPSNTSASYEADMFLTPFDRSQDMIATGSLINTYTGEVAACFEDAPPPPDRIAGDTVRERKGSQLRLLAAEGNVPSSSRRKKEQEDPLQPGDAGAIVPAASHRIGADVQMERAERSERDLYFNRNELAPTELMQTRNPFGFDGYSNRLRIQPFMPTTQELDNKSWIPNATARPSSTAQPRAAQRLSQDALGGREGPAGCTTHTEPGSLMANVRVEDTNRNLEGQSAKFNLCASQLYGASAQSTQLVSLSQPDSRPHDRGRTAVNTDVGSAVMCASPDSVLSTLKGHTWNERISTRADVSKQVQGAVLAVGESSQNNSDSVPGNSDGRAAAHELPSFVTGSLVVNEGGRGTTASREAPTLAVAPGFRVASETRETYGGRLEQQASTSLPQIPVSRADTRTSALDSAALSRGLAVPHHRTDAPLNASFSCVSAHRPSDTKETPVPTVPRNARPWCTSEPLVNASRRHINKPEWLNTDRATASNVSMVSTAPALPAFGHTAHPGSKHAFWPTSRDNAPHFPELASVQTAEQAIPHNRGSQVSRTREGALQLDSSATAQTAERDIPHNRGSQVSRTREGALQLDSSATAQTAERDIPHNRGSQVSRTREGALQLDSSATAQTAERNIPHNRGSQVSRTREGALQLDSSATAQTAERDIPHNRGSQVSRTREGALQLDSSATAQTAERAIPRNRGSQVSRAREGALQLDSSATAQTAEQAKLLFRSAEVQEGVSSARCNIPHVGSAPHVSAKENREEIINQQGLMGASSDQTSNAAYAPISTREQKTQPENTRAYGSNYFCDTTATGDRVPGATYVSGRMANTGTEHLYHAQITNERTASAALAASVDLAQQSVEEHPAIGGGSDSVTFMDVSARCPKRAPERTQNERSGSNCSNYFDAHASYTGSQNMRTHRKQPSEPQSIQGGAADVARRIDSGTLFVSDLRGLQEILPPVVALVGGDVIMDPMRRFDAGLRTLREEMEVTPQIIYADQRLNERASIGHLHSPHRRELRIVRSPKSAVRVRSGLAQTLSGTLSSRCEEIVE
uniref:Uncharacterized protein n=1 Tax=viral metagenome TaxID=1070528 RepID=A0A6C0BZY6_9ZZZZ